LTEPVGVKRHLSVDRESIIFGFTFTPFIWGLRAEYDPYTYVYHIVAGPFALGIGWPFYWQERYEDDMNIITLFGPRGPETVGENDELEDDEDADY